MGANLAQYGDGTGKIVFNGGPERDFLLAPGPFDGTFAETVDGSTPGNYIVYKGVTGSSFTARTWGLGNNGFNHIGPTGFQIASATLAPFEITSVVVSEGTVTLTWRSLAGENYVIKYSTDLTNWDPDIDDSITSAEDLVPDDGDLITFSFDLADYGLDAEETLYFRVEK